MAAYAQSLKTPSLSTQKELEDKRTKLQMQLRQYTKRCSSLSIFEDEGVQLEDQDSVNMERTAQDSQDEWGDDDDEVKPESATIFLPSNISSENWYGPGLEEMARVEAQLRVGQIHDALQCLRIALGEKSLIYRTKVEIQISSCNRTDYLVIISDPNCKQSTYIHKSMESSNEH